MSGGGTCRLGVAGAIPSGNVLTLTTAGTTLDLNGINLSINSIAGTAGTVAVGSATLTVSAPAGESYGSVFTSAAAGKVIKNGTGVWTLTGNSTGFAGEFVVNDGTIGYGGSGALGANATAGTITLNGGKLSNNGTGGRSVVSTVSVNLSGDFTVDDSLFNSSAPGQIAFNGPITIKNGNRTVTVNGLANLGLAGAVGQDVAGRSLIKAGTGLLALTGANTYTGDTTISGGTVNISSTSTLGDGGGTLHLSGGKLNTTGSRTPSSAPVANPVDITADSAVTTTGTAATIELNFSSSTIGGSAGTLTISNSSTTASALFQPRFSGGSFSFSRPIIIANGASGLTGTTALNSYNTTGTDQTFSGVISGTGSYIRNASSTGTGGRTIFTAANTYSGGTTVNRGTLLVNNTTGSGTGTGPVSVASDGTLGGTGTISGTVTITGGILSPGGSIGTLTLGSNPSLGGTTLMEVNSTNSPNADKLVVSGNPLAFGGVLTINNIGPALVGGEIFDLFAATSFSGSFSTTNLPALGAGLNWWTSNSGTVVTFVVNRAPTASNVTYNRDKGASVKILKSVLLAATSDLDSGDSVSYDALVSSGTQGAIVTQDATAIYYEPTNDFSDTLQYRVKDARGGNTTTNILINVVPSAGTAQSITVVGGIATANFAGVPGYAYQIQRASDLAFTTDLRTWNTNAPANGIFSVTDDFSDLGGPPGSAYYRLKRP